MKKPSWLAPFLPFQNAFQLYQRAVLGHPHNAVLHANLAAIFTRSRFLHWHSRLSRLSRYPEALQHAETAVSLEPKWGKAFFRKVCPCLPLWLRMFRVRPSAKWVTTVLR